MPAFSFIVVLLALLPTVIPQTASAQEVSVQSSNYTLGVKAFQQGDYRRAFDAWSLGSYEGNAEAQYNLGVLYLEGQGVKADVEQARVWFTKAAHQNHLEAQYNLGHMSLNGMGVEKNVETALRWWKRAAEGGYAQAQFNYGRALYLGIEGLTDKQGGLQLIRLAGQQKDKRALKFLENNAPEIAQLDQQNTNKSEPEVLVRLNSDSSESTEHISAVSLPDSTSDSAGVQAGRDDQTVKKDYIIRSANVPVAVYTQADFRTSLGRLVPGTLLKVKTIKGSKAQVSAAKGISRALEKTDKRLLVIQPEYGWIEAKNLSYTGETAQQLKAAWEREISRAPAQSTISETKPKSSVTVNIKARNQADLSAQVVALDEVKSTQDAIETLPVARSTVNDNVWLFTQEEGAYVIQLFSLLNIERAHAVAQEDSFRDRAHLYTTQINNKKWAVLLLGPYSNAEAANAAHRSLPGNYAGMGIVKLISMIASQRCEILKRLDAEQSVGLDAYCL